MPRASSRSCSLPHRSFMTIVCSGAAMGSRSRRQATCRRVLRTSSRLRLFGGIAQAPRGFDEFESHFQRLAWSETSRPEGRVREGSESFLVSVPSLPESVHISGSPHGVLDDSSLKYETILERNRSHDHC